MAKFNAAFKGLLAREKAVAFKTIFGQECSCDLGVLSADNDAHILKTVSDKLGDKHREGSPLFEFECALEKVALMAIDSDSPEDAPERYFAGTADVRKHLDREAIVYLSQRQVAFQAKISPLRRGLSNEEYIANVYKLVAYKEGDEDPFSSWAPSLRLSFMQYMAYHLSVFLTPKSNGSSTPESPPSANTPGSSN